MSEEQRELGKSGKSERRKWRWQEERETMRMWFLIWKFVMKLLLKMKLWTYWPMMSVIQYLKHSVKTVFKCPHVTFNIFYLTLQFFLIFCTVFTLIYPVIVVDLKSQEIYFYLFKDSLNSSVAGARWMGMISYILLPLPQTNSGWKIDSI